MEGIGVHGLETAHNRRSAPPGPLYRRRKAFLHLLWLGDDFSAPVIFGNLFFYTGDLEGRTLFDQFFWKKAFLIQK